MMMGVAQFWSTNVRNKTKKLITSHLHLGTGCSISIVSEVSEGQPFINLSVPQTVIISDPTRTNHPNMWIAYECPSVCVVNKNDPPARKHNNVV